METTFIKTKVCSKCKRELPITEFSKHRRSKDGLQCSCKQCQKEYMESIRSKQDKIKQERKNFIENGNPKLKEFTPRQLMDELIARGYRGELIYVQKIKL